MADGRGSATAVFTATHAMTLFACAAALTIWRSQHSENLLGPSPATTNAFSSSLAQAGTAMGKRLTCCPRSPNPALSFRCYRWRLPQSDLRRSPSQSRKERRSWQSSPAKSRSIGHPRATLGAKCPRQALTWAPANDRLRRTRLERFTRFCA